MQSALVPFTLPHLLAGQYLLISQHSREGGCIYYVATQKDTQREVLIRSLHAGAVDAFIEDARACSRVQLPYVSAVIEMLPAEGGWHVVFEGNGSDSLNFVAAEGRKVSASVMVNLLQKLSSLCLLLDAEHINSGAFRLEHVYLHGNDILLDNPACSGSRHPKTSNCYMIEAAKALLPLLAAADTELSDRVRRLLQWIADMPESCVLLPAEVLGEVSRLPAEDSSEDMLL